MKYLVLHNVPILDEHQLKDRSGNPVVDIDAAMLQRIAENNNRRVAETGDEVPIVVGHTRDDATEPEQPEIVGYARDFVVKALFQTGRKALFARTWKILKDKVGLARKFPRRSVELWLKRLEIDPISLLGATTPERNLGLLRFGRGDPSTHILSPTQEKPPVSNDKKEIVDAVLAAIKETDVWKKMEQMLDEGDAAAEPDMPPGDEPLEAADADVPPEEEGWPEEPVDDDMPPKKDYAAPSGTNTHVGAFDYNCGPKKLRRGDVDRVRLQRDQARLRANHAEQKAAKLETAVRDLQRKFRRADREKDLVQLEAEGYLFDRDEELQTVTDLNADQYSRYLDRIRVRYQRAPLGGLSGEPLRHARGGDRKERSRAEVDRAIDYASSHGVSYEDAIKVTTGGEKVF